MRAEIYHVFLIFTIAACYFILDRTHEHPILFQRQATVAVLRLPFMAPSLVSVFKFWLKL